MASARLRSSYLQVHRMAEMDDSSTRQQLPPPCHSRRIPPFRLATMHSYCIISRTCICSGVCCGAPCSQPTFKVLLSWWHLLLVFLLRKFTKTLRSATVRAVFDTVSVVSCVSPFSSLCRCGCLWTPQVLGGRAITGSRLHRCSSLRMFGAWLQA